MNNFIKVSFVIFIAVFVACKKDEKNMKADPTPTPTATTGALRLHFENNVGGEDLVFGRKYVNPHGDTFQVSKFNYYISNVVITNTDNTVFIEPNSYHLIQQSDASQDFTVTNMPFGSYKSLSFMLGVDSARNVSGSQTGALDPLKDMFWSWNTGYIFFKLEGTSPQSPDPQHLLTYHIGGFAGPYKGQRNYNFNFGSVTAMVTSTFNPEVHLSVDVNQFFGAKKVIDVSATGYYNHTTVDSINKILADNYAEMISFEHIHNN